MYQLLEMNPDLFHVLTVHLVACTSSLDVSTKGMPGILYPGKYNDSASVLYVLPFIEIVLTATCTFMPAQLALHHGPPSQDLIGLS